MKTETVTPLGSYYPTDSEIREKALELYIRSGWIPGRDLDNWLEAEAFLLVHPPGRPKLRRPRGPRPVRRGDARKWGAVFARICGIGLNWEK